MKLTTRAPICHSNQLTGPPASITKIDNQTFGPLMRHQAPSFSFPKPKLSTPRSFRKGSRGKWPPPFCPPPWKLLVSTSVRDLELVTSRLGLWPESQPPTTNPQTQAADPLPQGSQSQVLGPPASVTSKQVSLTTLTPGPAVETGWSDHSPRRAVSPGNTGSWINKLNALCHPQVGIGTLALHPRSPRPGQVHPWLPPWRRSGGSPFLPSGGSQWKCAPGDWEQSGPRHPSPLMFPFGRKCGGHPCLLSPTQLRRRSVAKRPPSSS